MFERLLETRRDGKHGVTKMYRILTELDTDTKLIFITNWERDMEVVIDEDQRNKIFRLVHESVSMREVEINYKCLTRWHITPSTEHRMRGENSKMCWRGVWGRGHGVPHMVAMSKNSGFLEDNSQFNRNNNWKLHRIRHHVSPT
ncbi:unnamed protein product [Staurois parvus]|uniref:Uncharacterized protein n=1 Tax=Staurois parvus TaxID=386267 RepID=A0ABN9ERQ2_9NEOB|nr:unnamed protein product [Staurois parvus]